MQPRSLRTRILFLSSSLVVVTMALVLGILLLVLGGVMRSSTARAVDRTNGLLEQTIAHYKRELSVEVAMLSDRQGTKNIYQADAKTISDHLEEQKDIIGFDWLVLTDPSGQVLGKTAKSPTWTQQRLPEFMKQTRAIDGNRWAGTVQSENTAGVIAMQPIYIGAYHQATLVAGLNIDDAFLRRITESAQVELMLSSGSVPIASTTSIRTLPMSKQTFRRIQIGKEVYLSGPGVSPGSRAIGNLQFTVLTPEAAITGPFQPLFTSFAAVMALGVVMAIIFGAMLAVSVTNPLQELLSAASELSAGRWPKPFSTERKDEIGVLQNAFDGMTISLRETRDRLVTMLDIDPLTEARNYRSFRERLEAEVADAPLERASLGIVLLGIDNFEKYNQVYGPAAADRVLSRIAHLIRELAHPDDFVGRYGGDNLLLR